MQALWQSAEGKIMLLRKCLAILAVASVGVLAACGSSDPSSEPGDGGDELAAVSLRMPWLMRGYMAPFNLAKERGFYKDAGLDVEIGEGKGSVTTSQTVARGSDDFGFVDATSAAMLIAQGGPIKVIAAFQQQTAASFIYRADYPVKTAGDLKGRPIVHSASDNVTTLAPAVLANADLNFQDLNSIVVEPAAAVQTMLSKPDSVLLANANSTYQDVQALEPDAEFTLFSDLGVNVLGFALITSQNMIDDHPKQVQAMVDASVKGWEAAQDDPEAAADATAKAFPDVDRDVQLSQLKTTLPLMHTSATKGKPVGWMAEEDWKQTISILRKYADLKGGPSVDDYFTNEFISAAP